MSYPTAPTQHGRSAARKLQISNQKWRRMPLWYLDPTTLYVLWQCSMMECWKEHVLVGLDKHGFVVGFQFDPLFPRNHGSSNAEEGDGSQWVPTHEMRFRKRIDNRELSCLVRCERANT